MCAIMDNAPVHNDIQNMFPNREIVYLPKYSPFLNPIENVFSVLKTHIKRKLNNIADRCDLAAARRANQTLKTYREALLLNAINSSLGCVTPDLCQREYELSNGYLRNCLQLVDIFH